MQAESQPVRLRHIANELLSVADTLEVAMLLAEKVKGITDILGTGETAHRLRVDPASVIRWRNGRGILEENLRKVNDLYNELFGKE